MQKIQRTELPVALEAEGVEVRATEVGELTAGWFRIDEGVDLGPALVGLPGDLCPCPHWGYMLKGRLLMRTANGDREYRAGEAFYWAPGHAPVALEDCEYVDFSPTKELAEVVEHITGGSSS
jgi:hypothetical protein